MSIELELEGRVAVVTGAGRGLGRAYAMALGARGVAVVVNDLGGSGDGTGASSSPADDVAAAIRAAGGRAAASHASVTDPAAAQEIVDVAHGEFGRLDIVVNNAGFLRDRTLAKIDPADFEAVVAVHLLGAAWVSRAAWPLLRESGAGRLVHATSAAGLFGSFGQPNYSAAKGGIVGLSRTLAIEGERHGIASNVIAPVARTRMTEEIAQHAVGALAPEAVAPVVTYLASPACTLSGEVLTSSGGHVARVFTGLTPGWTAPSADALTAEMIAEHLGQITTTDGFSVPQTAAEEVIPHLQRQDLPEG